MYRDRSEHDKTQPVRTDDADATGHDEPIDSTFAAPLRAAGGASPGAPETASVAAEGTGLPSGRYHQGGLLADTTVDDTEAAHTQLIPEVRATRGVAQRVQDAEVRMIERSGRSPRRSAPAVQAATSRARSWWGQIVHATFLAAQYAGRRAHRRMPGLVQRAFGRVTRAAGRVSHHPMWILDDQLRFVYANAASQAALGCSSQDEMIGRPIFTWLRAPTIQDNYRRARREGYGVAEHWLDDRCYRVVVYYLDGAYYGEAREIRSARTRPRHLSDPAMRQMRQQLAQTHVMAGVASWSADPQFRAIVLSDEAMTMLGLHEHTKRPWYELAARVDETGLAELRQAIRAYRRYSEPLQCDISWTKPTGDVIDLMIRAEPMADGDRVIGTIRDVSAWRLREQHLRENVARYELALQSDQPFFFFQTTPDGVIMDCSDAVVRILGRKAPDVVGRSLQSLMVSPSDHVVYASQMAAALQSAIPTDRQTYQMRTATGERRLVAMSLSRIALNGDVIGYAGMAWDVTDHATDALRARVTSAIQAALSSHDTLPERLQGAVEALVSYAPLVCTIDLVDPSGRLVRVAGARATEGDETLWGCALGSEPIHVTRHILGATVGNHSDFIRAAGLLAEVPRWLAVPRWFTPPHGHTPPDATGLVVGPSSIEGELRRLTVPLALLHVPHRTPTREPRDVRELQATYATAAGEARTGHLPPNVQDFLQRYAKKFAPYGVTHLAYHPVVHQQECIAVITWGARANGQRGGTTVPTGMDTGILQRFAERVGNALIADRLHEERSQAEERYRRIFQQHPLPSFVYDGATLRILDANQAMIDRYGYRPVDLMRMHTWDLTPPLIPQQITPSAWRTDGEITTQHETHSGEVLDVTVTHFRLQSHPEEMRMAIIEDRTEGKVAAAYDHELRHLERLAVAGEIAASVAHEVSHPLQTCMMLAHILQNTQAGHLSEEGLAQLAMIEEEAASAARTMRALLDTTREQSVAIETFPFNEVVRRVLTARSYALRAAGITVTTELTEDASVRIRGDRAKLSRVVLNIIENALYVLRMLPSGTLAVRTWATNGAVWCQVQDSGPGIAADILPVLFDRYVTSKPQGEGTGLGLPIARAIVEEHGGTITAANGTGGGARFTIKLPLASVIASSAAPRHALSDRGLTQAE